MSRNSALFVLAACGILAGCADYLNRYDSVTLAAGDAQKQNMLLQTANPFNPDSKDVTLETSGQRAADIAKKYETSQGAEQSQNGNVTVNVATGGGAIGNQ